MFPEIERVLIDRARIASRVRELADQLCADLRSAIDRVPRPPGEDARIVIVPIMSGAIVFVADLLREMPMKVRIGLVAVRSYPGKSMASKGAAIASELPEDLAGAHVVVVDDILDSGQTLEMVRRLIAAQHPASLRACVLLRKNVRRAATTPDNQLAEHVGFDIPDEFVVGYGLDYDGHYRNYPSVATLRREVL